jgi:signal peptidase II
MQQIKRISIIILLLLLCIGSDQFSKKIVRNKIEPSEKIILVDDVLTLTRVENTGAFLSLGHDMSQPWRTIVLTLAPSILIVIAVVVLLTGRQLSWSVVIGLCFVVGGGLGNIYDRIAYGSVTDFIPIDFGLFETGIFNFADMAVMSGVGLLLLGNHKKSHDVGNVKSS